MADLSQLDPLAYEKLIRAQAKALRAGDEAPPSQKAWEERRSRLRQALLSAIGPLPPKPCALEPKVLGVLKRPGYAIEKLVFQSQPDVWVTANAFVPARFTGKLPAVLVVHGHSKWGRYDPLIQHHCLGLVQLGYFVLAVDAFGAGERHTKPAFDNYHGALYGSSLWPAGLTLLGLQVYDNRRAVDYLLTRPEVDGARLGITGSSGGGNQSMYAGALDERLQAIVPVCSVGSYQAYLQAACCVCEVVPGALRFTEEGDVLGLTAPRSLLVITATRDAIQFSPQEAHKSLTRAKAIYRLYQREDRLRHLIVEDVHSYSQPMRQAMYGWMARWLKNEGSGQPIAEPKHELETVADLRCFPDAGSRPKRLLFPPSLAGREGRALAAKLEQPLPDHLQWWQTSAMEIRAQIRDQVFGGFPRPHAAAVRIGKTTTVEGIQTTPLLLHPEPELPLPALWKQKAQGDGQLGCILLHLDGKVAACTHPLADALVARGWAVVSPDLRGTGETDPKEKPRRGAPDHDAAEHAVWIGRPLLGQWTFDVLALCDCLQRQPELGKRRWVVAGLGPAGLVALSAAGLGDDRLSAALALGAWSTFVSDEPCAEGTRMGLLAPGILRWADVPHLAALAAPRRLILAEPVTPQGQKLTEEQARTAFRFTRHIYQLHQADVRLTLVSEIRPEDLAARLG